MCDVGGSGTGAERNTRDSGQRQDTDKISENCDKTRIEGGNKECGSKGEISKGTAVENCKSQDFRRYPEETALGKQWTEQGQRKTEGFTNVSGSKEDLSSQLAFTGTRKLRSQSLREERSKKRSHSVLDFNIPEKSSLPLYRSLPQRPQVQMAEADIGKSCFLLNVRVRNLKFATSKTLVNFIKKMMFCLKIGIFQFKKP